MTQLPRAMKLPFTDGRMAHEIPGHGKWWALMHADHDKTGPIYSCPFCHPQRTHAEAVEIHLAWCRENERDPWSLLKKEGQ